MTVEEDAVGTVASLMALSARTAPKSKGTDVLVITVIGRDRLGVLADEMRAHGKQYEIGFFLRDAENVANSDACVIIGARGGEVLGLNCGGCGYPTCQEMSEAYRYPTTGENTFGGPNCVLRMADLGIAVGSAVKTASIHNVDNRVMYSGGVGALRLGWLEGCSVAFAIPLRVSGKNIYFDRAH
ncbi:MAG: hypothetical protein APR53_07150 [Methanoculleus sp. SDB]|nr:MAG: hypothetical protein APR53_07150 [Methanoculleus sp. SDB]